MKLIEHHINNVFSELAKKHFGRYVDINITEEIPTDISFEDAMRYTFRFIAPDTSSKKPNYRYDRYTKYLTSTLHRFHHHFNRENKRIMHLDLGCGPGLFSWVVWDYAIKKYGKKPGDIELIGYDHAENMIRLAHLFRDRFRGRLLEYNFEGYYELDKIQNILESKDLSGYVCIITFGYVLVQTEGDREAMQNFVDIIRLLFPVNSCILMAVDAFKGLFKGEDPRQKFGNACEELWDSLSKTGINVIAQDKEHTQYGCWMHSLLSKET